jgi:pyridoxal phosphate enzyme (YggS family)
MSIAANLKAIRERIAAAAARAGRDPAMVRLVAVSKTQPVSAVLEAARAGQLVFGENYVQELTAKAREVSGPAEWHFIGHLQSNKVRQIAGLVSMVHSVDRFSVAREIDRQWGKAGRVCDILVEVNVASEATKSGAGAGELFQLVRDIARLPHVRIRGLMTMPPFFDDPEGARPYFSELRRLAAEVAALAIEGVAMDELSMGMSGDFEVAIEEGATLVRVGSAIFGERHYTR